MENNRWLTLVLVLSACSSEPSPSGPSAGMDSAPPGLFGGSGGGAGNGTVVLVDQDAGVALPEDGSVDVGESDGAAEVLDAGPDATVLEDAGADAGGGAGPLYPQCRTCGEPDSEFPTCPEGFRCTNPNGGALACWALNDDSGKCLEPLVPHPFPVPGQVCQLPAISCSEWLGMYGR